MVPGMPRDPLEHELLVHQAQPAVQVHRVPLAEPDVLDPGNDGSRVVKRGELPLGRVQVVLP